MMVKINKEKTKMIMVQEVREELKHVESDLSRIIQMADEVYRLGDDFPVIKKHCAGNVWSNLCAVRDAVKVASFKLQQVKEDL